MKARPSGLETSPGMRSGTGLASAGGAPCLRGATPNLFPVIYDEWNKGREHPVETAQRILSAVQAWPALADSVSGSTPRVFSDASHLLSSARLKTRSGLASAVSQPFMAISDSSCPGPQPA